MAAEAFSDEMLAAILGGQNPWWRRGREGAAPHACVPGHVRGDLDEVIGGLGDGRIHALVGPRQSGKTCLLWQLAARLVGDGCDPRRILYASLAEPPLSLGAGQVQRALEWYVRHVAGGAPEGAGGRLYVMLDEVQDADYWQGAIERWYAGGRDAKFFVSASSDVGERGGASGPLAGRMRRQHVMPLSFAEYASLEGIDAAGLAGARMRGALAEALAGGGDAGLFYDAAKSAYSILAPHIDALRVCLSVYLVYGGRPGVAMRGDRSGTMAMLSDSLQLALYKDVVRVGGVKNTSVLDAILSILAWESPRTVNVSGLARDIDADRDTVGRCLRLLEAAHIVYGAPLYPGGHGGGSRAERRMHIRDPGTRTAALRSAATPILCDPADAERAACLTVCDHALRLAGPYDAAATAGGGWMCYWRSGGGDVAVDAVVRIGERALPVTSRHQTRIRESDLRGLRRFADRFDSRVGLAVSDSWMGMADDGIVVVPLWLYLLMC